ncbi:heme exporter protein CcmD [Microbulbifer harenosus]|uniref:Heme exporter protein D n=1 Tax=Microbulbifer harenosus TaxID=2576840 RepID=A0ABY2UPW4_9GAMM|nr:MULTISPECIES: heme exporter protein CcmD [Microbulbifer]QIL89465.1 heme exporter protein CcmD [Microbulbifer sp. SH-1]TLM78326.1 heme exporter protein CcmD [Microbulbifer harenosus]
MQFQFENFASFLAMNGHGPYVWFSYGVTIAVMAALVLVPVLRQRQMREAFRRQLRQEQARRRSEIARAASETAAAD